MQQWDKALGDCRKAIELSPDSHNLYEDQGRLHLQLKEWGNALADYTKAIELAPDSARLYQDRALTYCRLSQWDRATTDFREALRITPGDPWLWRRLFEVAVASGTSENELNDLLDEADTALSGTGLLLERAAWHLSSGRRQAYEKVCREAAERFPDSLSVIRAAPWLPSLYLTPRDLSNVPVAALRIIRPHGNRICWVCVFCATDEPRKRSRAFMHL